MNSEISQLGAVRNLLPLSEATYLILLALTEPRHGYAIMQTVSAIGDGAVKLGPGTLYGALNNLLKQGLIERAGEDDAVNERRKLYALTPAGRATLELECNRLESMAHIGQRVLGQAKGSI